MPGMIEGSGLNEVWTSNPLAIKTAPTKAKKKERNAAAILATVFMV
jgi:hypothetical protein